MSYFQIYETALSIKILLMPIFYAIYKFLEMMTYHIGGEKGLGQHDSMYQIIK